jgi:hypothetical protein
MANLQSGEWYLDNQQMSETIAQAQRQVSLSDTMSRICDGVDVLRLQHQQQ